ncbi:MAG: SMI1/KNR4 family protein [Lachnospiraceae bacterium]|nr:SMI1/KNR4 family protein [Lachnospiraceae bacterium]
MFVNTSKAIGIDDIIEIERKINLVLPKQLVKHYIKYNGGIPEKRFLYSCISDIETSVQTFLSMKYKNEIGYTLEDMYLHFVNKNVIQKKYVPFACDAGSNLFCIDVETGKIVIVWMDMGEVNESMIPVLSNSFDEFIDSLEEDEEI